jgi:hypothetical protein
MTSRPAAEAVSSDSATETNATLRFSKCSSKLRRSLTLRLSRSSFATITAFTLPLSTNVSSRCRPGRFWFLADSPPSTMTSNNSAPFTVAMARTLASWTSSETPSSACCLLKRKRNRRLSSGHMVGNDPGEINEIVKVLWQVSLALQLRGGMDALNPAFCRTRRLTMTPNAEEQNNTPVAAIVQPPKATKRANVMPHKRRVAPGKPRSGKKGRLGRTAAQKPKGRRTGQACRHCRRGQQGSQSPKPAEAARRRFTERTHESQGWLAHSVRGFPSGIVAKRMRLVSAKSEDGSAAIPSKGRLAQPIQTKSRPAVFLCSLSSRTRGAFARAASFLSPYRAIGLVDKPSCPLRRLQLLFRVVNEDFPARSTLLAPRGNEEFPQSG